MKLNWKGWTYDLLQAVIRAMGVAGGVWGGYEIKYQELNWNDLWLALFVGGALRAFLHFLSDRPLPEDLDSPKAPEPTKPQ